MGFKRLRGDTRISWRVAEPVWRLYFELQYVHQGDVLRAELRLFRTYRAVAGVKLNVGVILPNTYFGASKPDGPSTGDRFTV